MMTILTEFGAKSVGTRRCSNARTFRSRPSTTVARRSPVGPLSDSLPTVALSPLAATLMDLPASVANKRLTPQLNPLDATLTKNMGEGPVIVNQISDVSRRGDVWTFRRGDVPFPALLFCSLWAGLDPCLDLACNPKEPHAVPSPEPHPQHGLLQAHPLVAISA